MQRLDPHSADVIEVRRKLDSFGRLLKKAMGVKVEPTEINGLYAEWLRPKKANSDGVLLYLHGGAYVLGSCSTHRKMVSHIARAAGIKALLPEYRLAPEHKFPAAIEDAVGVYRALLASGVGAENIVIGGDSAGGGLTIATLLSLRHAGDPMPRAAILLSPFLDVTASGESAQTRADKDPWFHADDISAVVRNYCSEEEVRHPMVSPVFANVAGLPPTFIQVGDHEILLSDSTRFADNMREAGCDVEIEVWPEMWHVWQLFVGKMPESRQAIAKIANFIRELHPRQRVPGG
ncbi:MAG: alpha/beta hydrolase [Gammaproteobacteria bacterium]|nr:alpha/beta hydrolase [Gammaproteobacteria bacterium]